MNIPFAKTFSISLLRQPGFPFSFNIDDSLREFFSTEQHISSQIFSLPISNHDRWTTIANTAVPFDSTECFLKVVAFTLAERDEAQSTLPSHGIIVSSTQTTLFQTANSNSFLPPSSPPPFLGMERYVSQLHQSISTSIKFRQNITRSCTIGIFGPEKCGKKTLCRHAAKKFGFNIKVIDCFNLLGDTASATEAKMKICFDEAVHCLPIILVLDNFVKLFDDASSSYALQDKARLVKYLDKLLRTCTSSVSEFPFIVIACDSVPFTNGSRVGRLFLKDIDIAKPNLQETASLWQHVASSSEALKVDENDMICRDFPVKELHGLVLGDLYEMRKAFEEFLTLKTDVSERGCGNAEDRMKFIRERLHTIRQRGMKDSGFAIGRVPDVTWSDIGGLSGTLERALSSLISTPDEPFHADEANRGLLLTGPPGVGKTLIAKALANQAGRNFMSVKGPQLINMYVGQSEANLRRLFREARQAAPCLIFFDELDSLAPRRGRSADSAGVMNRLVSQFVTEVDLSLSCESRSVFILGATNRVDLIDPVLLVPGRFGKVIQLDLYKTSHQKLAVFKAASRKMALSPELRSLLASPSPQPALEFVSNLFPNEVSGADVQAMCLSARDVAIEHVVRTSDHDNDDDVDECEFDLSVSLESSLFDNFGITAQHFEIASRRR